MSRVLYSTEYEIKRKINPARRSIGKKKKENRNSRNPRKGITRDNVIRRKFDVSDSSTGALLKVRFKY